MTKLRILEIMKKFMFSKDLVGTLFIIKFKFLQGCLISKVCIHIYVLKFFSRCNVLFILN